MTRVVAGIPELRHVAGLLKQTADKGLKRELIRGLNRAVKPLREEISAGTGTYLPARYAAIISRSVRVRASARGGAGAGASVRLVIGAKGKREKRDLFRVDKGELRHPIFGRSRTRRGRRVPSPWARQRVAAGVVTNPTQRLASRVTREVGEAIDRVRIEIEKG